VKAITQYASNNMQTEWQALLKKADKAKMFGRLA